VVFNCVKKLSKGFVDNVKLFIFTLEVHSRGNILDSSEWFFLYLFFKDVYSIFFLWNETFEHKRVIYLWIHHIVQALIFMHSFIMN